MTRRTLIAVFEVPGLGGASSSAYALFRKMRTDGLDVHLVNLVDTFDLPYIQYTFGSAYGNPRGLANVHTCVLDDTTLRRHDGLAGLVEAIAPDVILGYGDLATALVKLAAPEVGVVFYAAGSQRAGTLLARGRVADGCALLDRCVTAVHAPAVMPGRESQAVQSADLIVACSGMIQRLLEYFYPYPQSCTVFPEVIPQAEWIAEAAAGDGGPGKPFAERELDLLFVASSWARVEKNLPMVERIAARLPGARIGIVGEAAPGIPGATRYGFVADSQAVLGLMASAKAVVCPSRFDASPGILFQGSAMGCNIVASKNCGNWAICHDELLVEPATEEGFAVAAARAIDAKRCDKMRALLERRGYARLLEVLDVL